eukprot:TRINITY_DN5076_c0_g1_i1.p1 TRINITY_DN5076_c0_g1~~TRINITY_DN5076_c0_g1_i1.p1  ORF type:complete len:306 (-),score=38.89 TRINITY_DN5076_c0_g1_i1:206-994(-)
MYDTAIYYTARDAAKLGYKVFIISDAIVSSPRVFLNDTTIISDLLSLSVTFINSSQIPLAFLLDSSPITNKVLPPRYIYKDQLTTWQSASTSCLPYTLCPSTVYCPSGIPIDGFVSSSNAWAPVSDRPNEWILLSNNTQNTCSLFSRTYNYLPSSVQVTTGVPLLCCGSLAVPPPSSPSPSPLQSNASSPDIQPSPLFPSYTPLGPPARSHVSVQDDQVDSQPQVTRVALIACLCLGFGATVGLAAGCFLGKKGVINAPKIL